MRASQTSCGTTILLTILWRLCGSAFGQDSVPPGTTGSPLVIPEPVPIVIPGSADQQKPLPAATENLSTQNSTAVPGSPQSSAVVQLPATGAQEDEVLLSGPVHEAFAEQYNQDPVPGIIVPRQPPEPIEELPPDVRPDGRQVEWISGYWAWDDDADDFFWVSGIWREIPQGFRWLPGYWNQVDGGFQWVSGTWVTETTSEVQYIETAPPETLELGPVGSAPTAEHFWIPGCWTWRETRYAWRPGYWSPGYSNWIWVPARYLWTPRGYVFCSGYWDYPMARRGVLFAPNRFRRHAGWNRGFRFTPEVVIATNLIQWNFWVRPNYRHYYFGDYYGDRWANRGLIPWHQYTRQRRHFDPLYCHYNQRSVAVNVNFYDQLNTHFTFLQSHSDRRPVRSIEHSRAGQMFEQWERQPGFREQFRTDRVRMDDDRPMLLGRTLQQQVRDSDDVRFVRMDEGVRGRYREEAEQTRLLTDVRRNVEGLARLERNSGVRLPDRGLSLSEDRGRPGRDETRADRRTDSEVSPDLEETGRRYLRDLADRKTDSTDRKSDEAGRIIEDAGKPARQAVENLRLPPVARRKNDDLPARNVESSIGEKFEAPKSPAAAVEAPKNIRDALSELRERSARVRNESRPVTEFPEGGREMIPSPDSNGKQENRLHRDQGREQRDRGESAERSGAAESPKRLMPQTETQEPRVIRSPRALRDSRGDMPQAGQESSATPAQPELRGRAARELQRNAGPVENRRNEPSAPSINLRDTLRNLERTRPEPRETRELRPDRESRRAEPSPSAESPRIQAQDTLRRSEPERERRTERPAREPRRKEKD